MDYILEFFRVFKMASILTGRVKKRGREKGKLLSPFYSNSLFESPNPLLEDSFLLPVIVL
jgi:hypothetical protein